MANHLDFDALTAAIAPYASVLPATDREIFTREVHAELARVPLLGPGVVARVIAAVQSKYLDQSVTGTGAKRHLSKYSYDERVRPRPSPRK